MLRIDTTLLDLLGTLREIPHMLTILKFSSNGSSGTYGRVYKAIGCNGQSGEFAIKK